MRISDVISNVTKQNKTWTSWRQGTKLRVRLSLANAWFASLLSKVMYIIKRKFKCLSWIWLLFHLVKWKKCIFHSCLRHSWNIHFFNFTRWNKSHIHSKHLNILYILPLPRFRLKRGLITLVNDNHVDNYLTVILAFVYNCSIVYNRPKSHMKMV